jgi:hypothetical protein
MPEILPDQSILMIEVKFRKGLTYVSKYFSERAAPDNE